MRLRWALLGLVLLSGCLASATEDDVRGLDDGLRQKQVIGSDELVMPSPGRHTFNVHVPEGGAAGVAWRLRTSGANADSRFEGPGCDGSTGVSAGNVNSINGSCGDLQAGDHEFAVVVTGALLSYSVEVTGRVPRP